MNDMFTGSVFFGMVLSIAAFEIGVFIRKKTKLALLHPLLTAIVLIIVILLAGNISYDTYNAGAKYVSYLLTPATVCLALPLHEKISLLKKYPKAILAGIITGIITSALCIFAFCFVFGMDHTQYVTLLPKSITTAIGIGISEELGGIVNITVAAILITGVSGSILGPYVLKLFRINEPVAKGVAMGTASHAIGTSRAMEMGDVEGAMSSLALAVAGFITVFTCALFAGLI